MLNLAVPLTPPKSGSEPSSFGPISKLIPFFSLALMNVSVQPENGWGPNPSPSIYIEDALRKYSALEKYILRDVAYLRTVADRCNKKFSSKACV
jgi:hypothetical protein